MGTSPLMAAPPQVAAFAPSTSLVALSVAYNSLAALVNEVKPMLALPTPNNVDTSLVDLIFLLGKKQHRIEPHLTEEIYQELLRLCKADLFFLWNKRNGNHQ